ncbi:helix-turn-helix domain-containing protein [Streptomyces sp. NRRL_B-2557]|uniref:helix-turn-helix domain-containing protein n=1 Tax=Streptomyces sp. NRRL_B-2557 TaxID=3028698 RepID=UPI0029A942D9|nr:helix-turn-helix domain-containing protein [Streptomyces sp. NRRL_B-2557]MDX2748291.1 helix-turn-helix domain-containing protein [Streptomyces sp. NRRL_B-2557]
MPRLAKPAQGKYADFARSVRTLREAAGMSVQALSDASGVPLSSVYAAESGARLPSEENFAAMAQAMGTDVELATELRRSAHHNALRDKIPDTPAAAGDDRASGRRAAGDRLALLLRSVHARAGFPSLRNLAEATGTSPSVISRFLNGQLPADRHLLIAILEALDATEQEQDAATAAWSKLRQRRISKPTQQTLALLYGTATSCAYPRCTVPLVRWDGDQSTVAVVVAHIEPYSSSMRLDELDHFDNLILLCHNHHRSTEMASPADLRAWKADQAARSRAAATLPPQPDTKPLPEHPLLPGLPSAARSAGMSMTLWPAFEAFYLDREGFFHDFTQLHLGSRKTSEDVVHHTFMEILGAWATLLEDENLDRKAFAILQRDVQAVMDREGNEPFFVTAKATAGNLHDELRATDAEFGLIAEMTKLPTWQYQVLIVRYVLGYSVQKTAHYMGLLPARVRTYERLAKKRLRTQLGLPVTLPTPPQDTSTS